MTTQEGFTVTGLETVRDFGSHRKPFADRLAEVVGGHIATMFDCGFGAENDDCAFGIEGNNVRFHLRVLPREPADTDTTVNVSSIVYGEVDTDHNRLGRLIERVEQDGGTPGDGWTSQLNFTDNYPGIGFGRDRLFHAINAHFSDMYHTLDLPTGPVDGVMPPVFGVKASDLEVWLYVYSKADVDPNGDMTEQEWQVDVSSLFYEPSRQTAAAPV